ncbi:MAG TPA: hypothetical protein VHC72_16120 [Bryobacteraceae bacterium]|nr:hypothetical protein [Bryobacteraceae bacterium]
MERLNLAAIAVVLGTLLGTAAIADSVSIELKNGAFRVTGWNAPRREPAKGWGSVFAVYAGSGNVPPLLGSYAVEAGALVFHPRFPFSNGVHYRAVFRPPGGGAPVEKVFGEDAPTPAPAARVERVYPSADVLPSTLLRIYIYFSAPMSRGEAGRRIQMLDDKGKVLPGVFLPGEELWDPGFRRLTMTLDPGRIKRGLTSNEAMGPPIAEGKRYTLVIDRDWPDARGVRMLEAFRNSFRGGPADRTPPDPAKWKVLAPKAGTAAPLLVDFPSPMNYPLLQRMLQVAGTPGTASIGKQETEWRWTPREPWKAGTHQLIVDTALEDLAGNHIGQAFDIDVFQHVTEHITTKTISVPFAVH